MTITYGSVCSGIESASVAWEPLGMIPAWFAEIEKFPSAVLAHHWPEVVNLGDMCVLPEWVALGLISVPDILVGGTPCQAFSVAGLRKGLEDERGQLTIKFVELADAIDEKREEGDECVVVWENVPGVLSSKDNAFGCFLGALAGEECELQPAGKKWTNAGIVHGPKRTIAWRVLDAQYFGVAQRRRRVFVVASARDGFDPTAVLFEREGVRRDSPPNRETREETTGGAGDGSHWDNKLNIHPTLSQSHNIGSPGYSDQELFSQRGGGLVMAHGQGGAEVSGKHCPTLTCNHEAPFSKTGNERVECEAIVSYALAGSMIGRKDHNGPNGSGIYPDCCATQTSTDIHAVAVIPKMFAQNTRDEVRYIGGDGAISGALAAEPGMKQTSYLHKGQQVRRLTPTECERLQGFLDNHTRIPWRNKPAEDCPDGPRYKAIGNSKAVPVIKWLGGRILNELKPMGD